jgi:hypothetical protein
MYLFPLGQIFNTCLFSPSLSDILNSAFFFWLTEEKRGKQKRQPYYIILYMSTHTQTITMADVANDSDHTTSTNGHQNYETANEQLRSKIHLLSAEIQIMQSLLDKHKHCSKYRQNTTTTSSTMDSKAGKTQSLKCPA